MKSNLHRNALAAVLALAGLGQIQAQIAVPSDGSDGALVITTNTVIDLSLATTGSWNLDNTPNSGKGVHDPEKWAVVFKYSSVEIAPKAIVTFLNHPSHAPVVWLVKGSAIINGIIDISGHSSTFGHPAYLTPTEPGPGGFRGGAFGPIGRGGGFGPGGISFNGGYGIGASYVGVYGNPQIQPLIGGSGALGIARDGGASGPSGGGAILIAAAERIDLNGSVLSVGSINWRCCGPVEYSASTGGAIRLVADSITGAGYLDAGRTRTEANRVSPELHINPNTTAVPPGTTPSIWPPNTTPTVTILSVNGQDSPKDPLAGMLTSSDVSIGTNAPVVVRLETKNFPPSGQVKVRVTPKYADTFVVPATNISGDFVSALWEAKVTFPNGFCALQAHATSQ